MQELSERVTKGWACFAVQAEGRPFLRHRHSSLVSKVVTTGMGRRRAEQSLRHQLETTAILPAWVLSCGFAGGLDPTLPPNAVVAQYDSAFPLASRLHASGARHVQWVTSDRIVPTASEKQRLHKETGGQAVEMEMSGIQAACEPYGIPCATLRVVLDTATEDLPLDFNQIAGPELRIAPTRLLLTLMRSPGRIPKLLAFQRRCRQSARTLTDTLIHIVAPEHG